MFYTFEIFAFLYNIQFSKLRLINDKTFFFFEKILIFIMDIQLYYQLVLKNISA